MQWKGGFWDKKTDWEIFVPNIGTLVTMLLNILQWPKSLLSGGCTSTERNSASWRLQVIPILLAYCLVFKTWCDGSWIVIVWILIFCQFRNCLLQALETCFGPALRRALSKGRGRCPKVICTCTWMHSFIAKLLIPFGGFFQKLSWGEERMEKGGSKWSCFHWCDGQ